MFKCAWFVLALLYSKRNQNCENKFIRKGINSNTRQPINLKFNYSMIKPFLELI